MPNARQHFYCKECFISDLTTRAELAIAEANAILVQAMACIAEPQSG